jgi:hypothetical protein
MTTDGRRYVFAPLEQRGVVAGLRSGQIVLLGGALVIDTLLLRGAPNLGGVAAAAVMFLAATATAFVPIGGRPAEQWGPTLARRTLRLVTGGHRTRITGPRSPFPASGRFRASARHRSVAPLVPAPSAFRGLRFAEVGRPAATPVAVISDVGHASLTAILAVRGRSFTLLDATDKERRLASWSSVLAGLSREGGAIRSIQWVERTVPGDGEALSQHLEQAGAMPVDHPATRSYADLIASAGPLGQDHECFVALTVRMPRRRGAAAPEAGLLRELRLLEGQLRSAEIDVSNALALRDVGTVLRTAFDPWARTAIRQRESRHPDLRGPLPQAAWPCATEEAWGTWRTDETWHTTFWVAEWPRSEVGPDFLSPLLLHGAGQRSISVVMAPLPPSAGVREAEAARTAQVADEQLRQRAGFLSTARRQREAEGIARRETELSDGHAAYRFSGYVTVTARSQEGLEVACGEVIQAAHQCRLDLRRLHGVQDLAFTWAVPLGRGLATR